jgi:hypothetical protein
MRLGSLVSVKSPGLLFLALVISISIWYHAKKERWKNTHISDNSVQDIRVK